MKKNSIYTEKWRFTLKWYKITIKCKMCCYKTKQNPIQKNLYLQDFQILM